MSLAEALRARDPETFGLLYDRHGPRLYAYCHAVVGDGAGDAVRDAFVAAARQTTPPPADDAGLPVWLYILARAECARRDAPAPPAAGGPPPATLPRALGRLRREHRDTLALTAALEVDQIAEVLGVARDTADQMTRMARRRLEQAVLAVLSGRAAQDDELLTALGRGRLHMLVAAAAPEPPAALREWVLAACAAAVRTAGPLVFDDDGLPIRLDALFGPAGDATRSHPVVRDATVTSLRPARGRQPRQRRAATETALLAACVAVTLVSVTLWPSPSSPDRTSTVDGSTVLLHHGAPNDRPVPSSTGGTPLDRTPAAGGSRPTAAPERRVPAGRTGSTAPRPGATATRSRGPSPTRSPAPPPRPATPAPKPPTPGLPVVPGLTPSPTTTPHQGPGGP